METKVCLTKLRKLRNVLGLRLQGGVDEWDDDAVEMRDEFEEDWENVPTQPIVPLPGRGKRIIKKAITNAKKASKSIKYSDATLRILRLGNLLVTSLQTRQVLFLTLAI